MLALSDIATTAVSAYSAALTVSPPSEDIREAEKLVTVSMYSFADSPLVVHAFEAFSKTAF